MEDRFRSGVIGASKYVMRIYIQIDGLFQLKLGILETGDTLICRKLRLTKTVIS